MFDDGTHGEPYNEKKVYQGKVLKRLKTAQDLANRMKMFISDLHREGLKKTDIEHIKSKLNFYE